MDEQRERRAAARLRNKQVDALPRRIAIGKAELGATFLEHIGTIVLRLARPA